MDEFEQMWNTAGSEGDDNAPLIESETPEYQIRDGMARLKILADILINFYHAKYGEPLQLQKDSEEIQFHLKG